MGAYVGVEGGDKSVHADTGQSPEQDAEELVEIRQFVKRGLGGVERIPSFDRKSVLFGRSAQDGQRDEEEHGVAHQKCKRAMHSFPKVQFRFDQSGLFGGFRLESVAVEGPHQFFEFPRVLDEGEEFYHEESLGEGHVQCSDYILQVSSHHEYVDCVKNHLARDEHVDGQEGVDGVKIKSVRFTPRPQPHDSHHDQI